MRVCMHTGTISLAARPSIALRPTLDPNRRAVMRIAQATLYVIWWGASVWWRAAQVFLVITANIVRSAQATLYVRMECAQQLALALAQAPAPGLALALGHPSAPRSAPPALVKDQKVVSYMQLTLTTGPGPGSTGPGRRVCGQAAR